jgi:uncharacterized protein YhjY with autotransporter beta-barrel domain
MLLDAPGFLTVLDDLRQYNAAGTVADVRGAVFAVWTGGNDYSNYVGTHLLGGANNAAEVARVLDNIDAGLTTIASLGAKRAVVFNIFDLSRIPTFVSVLGTSGAQQAETLATLHNAALPARLARVRAATGLDVVLVDVDALYNDIFAHPLRYGFTNLTRGCIDESTFQPTGACPTPAAEAAALYWDGTHPTTTAHGYIAELYSATLRAVDQDGGRLAAIPDAALVQAQSAARAVRAQLDDWRAGTAAASGPGEAPAPREANGLSLFATLANEFGHRETRSGFTGYKYTNRGGLAGVEYRPRNTVAPLVLGAHVGAVDLDSDIRGGGDFDSVAYQFGIFGGLRSGPASVTAQVTASRQDVNGIVRQTGFSALPTARSTTHGWGVAGEIEARWDFAAHLGGQPLWIVPLARLSAATARVDGFTERGAEFLDLTVQDSDLSRVRGGVGLNAWTVFQAGSGSIAPFVTVVWERNLSSPTWNVAASLPSGQAVEARGGWGAEAAVLMDAGLRIDLGGGTSLDAQLSAAFRHGGDNNRYVVPQLRLRKAL